MNWFRLYYEARNDAKLRSLSDAEHRVWFQLLCFSAEQSDRGFIESVTPRDIGVTGVTPRDWRDMVELLAVECANNDTDVLVSTVEKLIKLRIVTPRDGGLLFINFDKRQYIKPSDSPEETRRRKAEQREREKGMSRDVTPTSRGVTPVTPPDTDTESDINNVPPLSPKGEKQAPEPKETKPRTKKTRVPDPYPLTDYHINFGKERGFDEADVRYETERFVNHFTSKGELREQWDASWRNWILQERKYRDAGALKTTPIRTQAPEAAPNSLTDYENFHKLRRLKARTFDVYEIDEYTSEGGEERYQADLAKYTALVEGKRGAA